MTDQNLIPNPSFEVDLSGWNLQGIGSPRSVDRSTVWSASGGASAHIIMTLSNSGGYNESEYSIGGFNGSLLNVPVTPGLPYTVSAVMNVIRFPPGLLKLYCAYMDSSRNVVSPYATIAPGATGIFNASLNPGIAPPTAFCLTVFVILFSGTATGQSCELYLDDVQVRQSSVILPYADGDTPGWYWEGTPGKSTSRAHSVTYISTSVRTDDRLALSVTRGDGAVTRWGPDEPNNQNVPDDLQFSTSMPGGDKSLSCSLFRKGQFPDESLFDDVMVYGPGNDWVWNGRTAQFPRDGASVQPSAVGWIEHLRDDTTAREVYLDRDMTRWGSLSFSNRKNLTSGNFNPVDGQVIPDISSGEPSIALEMTSPWDATHLPLVGMVYDIGQGHTIGKLVYTAWIATNVDLSLTAIWGSEVTFAATDGFTSLIGTQVLAGSGSNEAVVSGLGARFAEVAFEAGSANGNDGIMYGVYFYNVQVIGDHGVPVTGNSTDGYTMLVSDIVKNVLPRWGPLLNWSDASVEITSFGVPHFAQYAMVTGYDILAAANAFELNDWGVYSGGFDNYPRRTFFFRHRNPDRLTWRTRISEGAVLVNDGIQADQIVNGVVVNFTTPDGTNHTAGPIGSVCEFTDASLMDTDPTNPVNAHGIPRKYGILNMSKVTSPAGAIQIGAVWLSRRVGIQKRGTVAITGTIKHPNGNRYPVSRVRSGDYLIVEDDPRDTTPRQIMNTSYTHKDRTSKCDLEHPPFRIDAMLERGGVDLVGLT